MLQQTRVEAAIPYYERFLTRFPDMETLAAATEADVLAAWSGLGYYSRARNLHRAAGRMRTSGVPDTYEAIRALPGVGPYTAAAIASIAFGLPHAAVDGNVIRVLARVCDDGSETSDPAARRRFAETAGKLLDPARPGDFNQAMMELGATVCVPGNPCCGECALAPFCKGRAAGRERELPVKIGKPPARDALLDLALFEREGGVFLIQRSPGERRLADFWELPAKSLFPRMRGTITAEFTHRIVNDRFRVKVWQARAPAHLPEGQWVDPAALPAIPLTTITRKALAHKPVPPGGPAGSTQTTGRAR